MESKRLFIYGTLKRGEANHDKYLKGATLLGDARTKENYTLYTSCLCPAIDTSEPSYKIHGEVWEVSEDTFKRIEILEHYYKQEKVLVELRGGGEVLECVTFTKNIRGNMYWQKWSHGNYHQKV